MGQIYEGGCIVTGIWYQHALIGLTVHFSHYNNNDMAASCWPLNYQIQKDELKEICGSQFADFGLLEIYRILYLV
jgi:hypothetical protein